MITFFAPLIHFVVVFSFTLGFMNITASAMAISFLRSEIPSYKVMFIQNIISAVAICLSFLITVNVLPHLYKEMRVNDGVVLLKTNHWREYVEIKVSKNKIKYNLCDKEYEVENTMYNFYDSLNSSLVDCGLSKGKEVSIKIVSNPFKQINEVSTNSILRKHFEQ